MEETTTTSYVSGLADRLQADITPSAIDNIDNVVYIARTDIGACNRCVLRLLVVRCESLLYSLADSELDMLMSHVAARSDRKDITDFNDTITCVALKSTDTASTTDGNVHVEAVDKSAQVCPLCAGILSSRSMWKEAWEHLRHGIEVFCDGTTFPQVALALSLPRGFRVRRHGAIIYLCDQLLARGSDIDKVKEYRSSVIEHGASVKEVLRSLLVMRSAGDDEASFKLFKLVSDALITAVLTFSQQDSDNVVEIMERYEIVFNDEHPKRDGKGGYYTKKRSHGGSGCGSSRKARYIDQIGSSAIESLLKRIPDDVIRKEPKAYPPRHLRSTGVMEPVTCSVGSVFIGGRYCKYSRAISQTSWEVNGVKLSESSVEEEMLKFVSPLFAPVEIKFSSAGREDCDVRMLGDGRPFSLEIIGATRGLNRLHPDSSRLLPDIESQINEATSLISVSELQVVTKAQLDPLRYGQDTKTKEYTSVVWTERCVTQGELDKLLGSVRDLTIDQWTPIRVLHRRTSMMRPKVVYSLACQLINPHCFTLTLRTQGGTYIKEFVHGDRGRTTPNVGILLGCDVDILQLDVTNVLIGDWPPIRAVES